MAEADLNQILGYIQQREETLSRYSDKLRQSLVKIADVFGNPQYCQRCGKWDKYHKQEWKNTPEGKSACDNFKPGIYVSIDVIDDEPFEIEPENEMKYYLAILERNMGYVWTFENDKYMPKNLHCFDSAPRRLLKALVKSGRLIPFLQKVANSLDERAKEYKQVAEIAEKMAQAIDTV